MSAITATFYPPQQPPVAIHKLRHPNWPPIQHSFVAAWDDAGNFRLVPIWSVKIHVGPYEVSLPAFLEAGGTMESII